MWNSLTKGCRGKNADLIVSNQKMSGKIWCLMFPSGVQIYLNKQYMYIRKKDSWDEFGILDKVCVDFLSAWAFVWLPTILESFPSDAKALPLCVYTCVTPFFLHLSGTFLATETTDVTVSICWTRRPFLFANPIYIDPTSGAPGLLKGSTEHFFVSKAQVYFTLWLGR